MHRVDIYNIHNIARQYNGCVRPLSCVSCVPASCFHIWFVSCPRFMSLWVYSVPGVCVYVIVNYPVYLSPVFWVPFGLVYSLFPVFLCVCIALSTLDVVIKDYYFEVYPRLRVPRSSLLCAPWQDDILTLIYLSILISGSILSLNVMTYHCMKG